MHEISDMVAVFKKRLAWVVIKNVNYLILLCDPQGPFIDQTEHQTVCKVEPGRKIVLIKNP
jgi:hypothetical protein